MNPDLVYLAQTETTAGFLSQNAVMTSQDYLALSGATRYRSYEDLKQWETEGKLSAKGSAHSKFYILTNNSPEA